MAREVVHVQPYDSPPVVFVHVMKTGGTTLVEQVSRHLGPDRVWPLGITDASGKAIGSYAFADALLSAEPRRLRRMGMIAGHLPAVIVDVLAERLGQDMPSATIVREPVDRVISHLKQCRSAAGLEHLPLEAVYDDPRFHEPYLTDHQTKVFAADRQALTESPADSTHGRMLTDNREAIAEVLASVGPHVDPGSLAGRLAAVLPEDWDAERVRWGLMTPPAWWVRIDARATATALGRLESVDVVGVADDHPAFSRRLEARFGWRLAPIAARRVSEQVAVPSSLRRRIADDNQHDLVLYERARQLAGRTS